MEDILSNKVSLNPVRDVWSVEQPSPAGAEQPLARGGRVLVVSHYLPFTAHVVPEDTGPFASGSPSASASRRSSANIPPPTAPTSFEHHTPPSPEQLQAQLAGLAAAAAAAAAGGGNLVHPTHPNAPSLSPPPQPPQQFSWGSFEAAPPFVSTALSVDYGKRGSVGSLLARVGKTAGYVWSLRPSQNGNIGLFNAVNAVQDRLERVYIGECECEVPRPVQEEVAEELAKLDCVPVFTTAAEAHGHYYSFCKQVLWPMFHYIAPGDSGAGYRLQDQAWRDYCAVNQRFADVVAETYRPGDLVWVHDYHLCLVPLLVRRRVPDATVGFFLHIPFPSSEIFRCLHVRTELLDGMLGANVVGFQTYSFARHFLHTCSRLMGVDTTPSSVQLDSQVVYVGIFPIGINVESLVEKRASQEVAELAALMRRRYEGMRILVGREKLDHIKGVPNKLLAYEMFLAAHPEWVGRVVLIQVAMRGGTASKDLHTQVFDIVSRINGSFGSLEYSPVVYLHQNIPFYQYLALLTVADVCLITSLRDGMNLTSHEYVVCQAGKHSPLILSEFAGTYGSLGGAIRVNPWDYRQVAQSIHDALTMPDEERLSRHQELLGYVSMHTAQFWAESFVRQMLKMTAFTTSNPVVHDISEVERAFAAARRRLILLGFDGTLCKIRRRPEQALPSEETLRALERLAADPRNVVCVLTGRHKKFADRALGGVPNLIISAENGCLVRRNGDPGWTKLLQDTDLSWHNDVLDVLEYYTERTEGTEIEQKDFSLTWHYRNAEQIFGAWQAKECFNHLSEIISDKFPIITSYGNKSVEIQPIHVNKATVVRHVLAKVAVSPPPDLVLCIGSDKADEQLFDFLASIPPTLSTPPSPMTAERPALPPADAGAGAGAAAEDAERVTWASLGLDSPPVVECVSVGTRAPKAQSTLPSVVRVTEVLGRLASL